MPSYADYYTIAVDLKNRGYFPTVPLEEIVQKISSKNIRTTDENNIPEVMSSKPQKDDE